MENLRTDKPGEMNTLSQVMAKLHSKGYDIEFKLSDHGRMQPTEGDEIYNPDDLLIIKTYRFEGESDPSDNSVLYLCLLYTSPSPRDGLLSRMPSSA